MIPRTYDWWKSTNPADEWLGPDPGDKGDEEEPVIDWWEPEPHRTPQLTQPQPSPET